MKSIVEILDLHANPYTLHIFGKEKKQTNVGSIIGLASMIAMIVISSLFIKVLFQGTQMNLVTNYDGNIRPSNNLTRLQIQLGSASTGNPINMTGIVNIQLFFNRAYLNGISDGSHTELYQLDSCNQDDVGNAYEKGVRELFLCTSK